MIIFIRFNLLYLLTPLKSRSGSWSALEVEGAGVVVHTVKATEDGSGDVLLRLFESHGAKTKVT